MSGLRVGACVLASIACVAGPIASADPVVPPPDASTVDKAEAPKAETPTPPMPPTPQVTVARSATAAKDVPLDLSDHAIRKAIADSKELMDGLSGTPRSSFGSGGGAIGQARIDQAFREAEIPSCLTPDAFKFDPPALGPITFSGFAALPFWAHAMTSGICRF